MLFFVQSLKENVILVQSRANEHYLCIQHNWVNRDTKFHLSHTNLVFWTKFYQKRYFWSKTEKVNITIEFGIYIYISLDTKFHLKQTILIFQTRYAQKGYFWSKTEKLNITIEFSIFELVNNTAQNMLRSQGK